MLRRDISLFFSKSMWKDSCGYDKIDKISMMGEVCPFKIESEEK